MDSLASPLPNDDRLNEVMQLLSADKLREWRVLCQNASGCCLVTTVDPVFIPLETGYDGWKNSELRQKLNTVFVNSLPYSLAQNLCLISYSTSESEVLKDRAILLDSSEARLVKSYKPKCLSQEDWDKEWFDWFDYPCVEGFTFNVAGMSLDAQLGTLKWAQDRFRSDSWDDWILLRDDKRFPYSVGIGENRIFIPNGIHPVICIDLRPSDGWIMRPHKAVSLTSFWGEDETAEVSEPTTPDSPSIPTDSSIYDDDIPF